MRTAGQLATIIKQEVKMDIAELGENDSQRNTTIFDFMSLALREWARLAYQTEVSDALTVSADGYVTFQQSAADITDLFEPLRILDSSGNAVRPRTSFEGSTGWYKESANAQIHVKGITGDHNLHYLRYPAWITASTETPEWPEAGYLALIYKTCGMIKESKNYYDEADAMYKKADNHLSAVVMANESARGMRSSVNYQDLAKLRG